LAAETAIDKEEIFIGQKKEISKPIQQQEEKGLLSTIKNIFK